MTGSAAGHGELWGAAVTAGIGTVCNNLHDISISYEGSQRGGILPRLHNGTKRSINIAEIVPKESKKAVPLRRNKDAGAVSCHPYRGIRRRSGKKPSKRQKSSIRMQPPSASTIWLPWRLSADFSNSVPIIPWISMKFPEMYRTFMKE